MSYCFPFSLLNKPGYKSGILYLIMGKRYLTASILTALKMSVPIVGVIAQKPSLAHKPRRHMKTCFRIHLKSNFYNCVFARSSQNQQHIYFSNEMSIACRIIQTGANQVYRKATEDNLYIPLQQKKTQINVNCLYYATNDFQDGIKLAANIIITKDWVIY